MKQERGLGEELPLWIPYQIKASDPDEGDILMYSLLYDSLGAAISESKYVV